MLKTAVSILEAIEELPGTKYVSVGVLPVETYLYKITPENIVGNRLPILFAITRSLNIGGTLLVQHMLPISKLDGDKKVPAFHYYALLLGDKKCRVCTPKEFDRFFNKSGTYKTLQVKS